MPRAFQCPSCAAPLPPPAGGATTVTCPYCGAHAAIGRATGRAASASASSGSARGRGIVFGALALVVVGLAVVVFVGTAEGPASASGPGVQTEALPFRLAEPDAPGEAPGFAREVRRFGGEGTGAGRFDDARSVAVDGHGRLYVAEYMSGRVQVFDSTGAFQTQWMVEARPLIGFAAARDGTVYASQGADLRRYEGATGRLLGTWRSPRGVGFYGDVALALDGTLWVLAQPFHLIHLDRNGNELQRIDAREAIQDDAHPSAIAVSGTGDLYVADQVSEAIYRLDAAGRFVDRFGGRGDRADQFRTIADLAFDGRGRLYVSDPGRGVRVFTADGHFIDAFGGHAVVFGLAMDDQGGLWTAHRNDHQVVQYRLPE